MLVEFLETRRLLADFALVRVDGETGPATPDVRTWVLAHGWLGSPSSLENIAEAIRDNPNYENDQVLAIDWSDAASDLNPVNVENAIPDAGEFTAQALIDAGFDGSNVNFIGHSFGAYVAAVAVDAMPAQVQSMAALDPGQNLPGGFDSGDLEFSHHSRFSWAYHASDQYSSRSAPTTADEAFFIQIPGSELTKHNQVVDFFASVINHEASMPQALQIARLLDPTLAPPLWAADRIDSSGAFAEGDYEGAFLTTDARDHPIGMTFASTKTQYLLGFGTDEDEEMTVTEFSGGVRLHRNAEEIDVTLASDGKIILEGAAGDDELEARDISRSVILYGRAGYDSLVGGSGDDEIFGGSETDIINGQSGDDLLAGEAHADSVWGSDGDDTLTGASGNDYLRGENGNDYLDGGGGTDRLRGHAGADFIVGGGSNDKLYGAEGNDTLVGNAGIDRYYGDAGTDTAYRQEEDIFDSIEIIL